MTSYIRHRIRHILTNIPNSKFRETRRRITSNSPQEFYTHRFASRHRHDACARARSRLLDRAREHLYARADSAIARTGTRTATQQRCGRSSTPTPSDDASSASSSPPSRPRALLSATHAKLTDIQRYSRTPVPVNHSASSHPHMHGDDERRRPHHLPRPPPGHAHRARSLACPTRHFPTNRDPRAPASARWNSLPSPSEPMPTTPPHSRAKPIIIITIVTIVTIVTASSKKHRAIKRHRVMKSKKTNPSDAPGDSNSPPRDTHVPRHETTGTTTGIAVGGLQI